MRLYSFRTTALALVVALMAAAHASARPLEAETTLAPTAGECESRIPPDPPGTIAGEESPEHEGALSLRERPLARSWWPYLLGSAGAAAGGFCAFFCNMNLRTGDAPKVNGVYVADIALGLGIAAFVVSGSLAVVGLTLHFTWNAEAEAGEPPAMGVLSPALMPGGGGGLAMAWTF